MFSQARLSLAPFICPWVSEDALPPILENFCRAFSPGPTDRPWVSEDGKKLIYRKHLIDYRRTIKRKINIIVDKKLTIV